MTIKRLLQTMCLYAIGGPGKRADYLRKHDVFDSMGQYVYIQSRNVPLYAKLIRFHNNIFLASNVTFITHDVGHVVVNNACGAEVAQERVGCIEIMDNVFIGANVNILYGVRIGPNAVVGAGSVVTRDVPPNSVVAGNPARVVGSFEDYVQRAKGRADFKTGPVSVNQTISAEVADREWKKFEKKGNSKEK